MSRVDAGEPDATVGLGFSLLAAVFTGSLVIAAVLAAKIIQVGPFTVPAGVLAYSLTFACTDIISEVYGRARARQVVLAGFVALVAALVLIQLALAWPAAPFWQQAEAFQDILGSTGRIVVASLVAYLASQYTDVFLFAWLRRLTGGRFLWLRNNGSTMLSQLLDSALFVTIAFAGVFPLGPVILGQWLVKLAIAALDTPVVYAVVALLRARPPAQAPA
ncbi:MAG: queuosine precursor transporter [Alphaproteobacteria bacterium]|nr:queuosine precursor transporter [Alphaproteobacteria bacterium]